MTPARILCVEDDPDTYELIRAILHDYEVISAPSVKEACDLLKDQSFKSIILDYYLPDGTGLELCGQIRCFDPRTPIVFVTGSLWLDEDKVAEAGANALVEKARPDFVGRLISAIDQMALLIGSAAFLVSSEYFC